MVNLVDTLASARMMRHGFVLFPTASWFSTFPGRPLTLFSLRQSPVKNLSYWYRPHTSKKKLPILFLHGIGIGIYPYVKVLSEIAAAESDVGIIVVEYMVRGICLATSMMLLLIRVATLASINANLP